jgi:hypothetical protein
MVKMLLINFKFRLGFLCAVITVTSLLFSDAFAADKILSKSDADQMFQMPLADWKKNVAEAKRLGIALPSEESEREYTLVVNTPHGRLLTTPEYVPSDLTKPQKLVVTVLQAGDISILIGKMSHEDLKRMIADWHKDMLPEYTVLSKIEIYPKGNAITFTIFKYGSNSIIDQVGEKYQGCWKDCIQKN